MSHPSSVGMALSNGCVLEGYLRTNWSEDPYALGSYSFLSWGAGRADVQALQRPIKDRIFFAGEAAYPDYNSTVHAAYESGQSTAETVLGTGAKKVGVIGAGMSGLSAAAALSMSGIEVEVFEARDRIGGRVWTDQSLGLPLDLGGSWIQGSKDNPMTDLAAKAGIRTIKTGDDVIVRGRKGRDIPNVLAPRWLHNVASVQHTYGANMISVNYLAYLRVDDYDGPDLIMAEGYASLLDQLEAGYTTHLSSPVSAVSLTDNTVEIDAAGAHVFEAVIVTAPLGVLKAGAIAFDPPLPPRKQKAIDRLGSGLLDKVYLKFDKAFWDDDATWILTPHNELPHGQFNQWLNISKYLDAPVIMAFNGGPPARDLAGESDEEIIKRAMQTLNLAYPV